MVRTIKVFYIASLVCALFTLGACDLTQNYLKADRAGELEMQDFRDGLAQRPVEKDDAALTDTSSSIPALQPYVAQSSEKMKAMPVVSISVNQSVPLRDVLFELAEQADYDLELDPNIRGSIIFTARERPFDQVIERISDMAGLRYSFKDDVLRVELDTPYNKTYKIDYLSYIRSNAGSVRNDIAVVSGDGADTGSSFQADSKSEADFWGELEANLAQILGGTNAAGLRTNNDPRITATETNPDVQAVAPSSDGSVQVQPPQAILRVDSLPIDDQGSGNNASAPAVRPSSFAVNKQSGLVTVYASERQHEEVAEYLRILERAASAQVLIEAKILEVTLNDEYSTGIDWRAIGSEFSIGYVSQGFDGLVNTFSSPVAPSNTSVATDSNFVMGYAGNDAQAIIQAISGFGTVRALASPRMTVLNNQSAVLNVATNQVFFEIDIDTTQTDTSVQTDIQSSIRNVPEGILVNVQPSINLDKGTVALAVRPTITQVTNEVEDPAVQYITAAASITGVQSLVPELNVQEIDSVIQVRSGQPVVMGGLLQDRIAGSEEGVPVLNEVPMVGSLFKQHNDLVKKTELVIFLKATILDNPSDSIHDTDRDVYRKFASDRRPFKL
ncbi:MAG: type II and III secretion system family protein [Alphaproteobacteria bacterium]|nr:type II and III secretion system family protein [Alphaproteobacteria bacterium]